MPTRASSAMGALLPVLPGAKQSKRRSPAQHIPFGARLETHDLSICLVSACCFSSRLRLSGRTMAAFQVECGRARVELLCENQVCDKKSGADPLGGPSGPGGTPCSCSTGPGEADRGSSADVGADKGVRPQKR